MEDGGGEVEIEGGVGGEVGLTDRESDDDNGDATHHPQSSDEVWRPYNPWGRSAPTPMLIAGASNLIHQVEVHPIHSHPDIEPIMTQVSENLNIMIFRMTWTTLTIKWKLNAAQNPSSGPGKRKPWLLTLSRLRAVDSCPSSPLTTLHRII